MKAVERYHILEDLRRGYLKVKEVAGILGITRQHVYRLKKKVENIRMKGLVQGNRGKVSVRRISKEVEETIKSFYQEQYRGFNIIHFTEKLNEKEGMMLQYDTSDHDFLESRGPRFYLIGGIDDATNEVPFALFFLKMVLLRICLF